MKPRLVVMLLSIGLLSAATIAVSIGCTSRSAPKAKPEIADLPSAGPQTTSAGTPASVPASSPAASVLANSAGMTIYKDPVTGRLLPLPADKLQKLLSEEPLNAVNYSHQGLIETPAPGGGMMINLQGRFHNVMWATTGPDGKVTTQCDQHDVSTSSEPKQPRKE